MVSGVEIHPRLLALAEEFNHDLQEIADAILDPEDTWPGSQGGVVHLRGDIAVIAAEDTGEAIAMSSRERALQVRQKPRPGAIRKTHGGVGRRFPTDTADLLDRLDKAGFVPDRSDNHYVFSHPDHPGKQCIFAKSASDWRSIPNAVLDIRREFGIDLRDVR